MVYVFLADGFEEIEALAPIDLLRRAGIRVTTVGIDKNMIMGAHGINVEADITDKELKIDREDLEMIILPGGMPGTLNLNDSATVHSAIDVALACDSFIAAICAAPSILGERGLLVGKEAICYPGFEDKLVGAKISDKKVVVDGKIITAAGMGVAVDFGLSLVSLLCSDVKALELRSAIIAD